MFSAIDLDSPHGNLVMPSRPSPASVLSFAGCVSAAFAPTLVLMGTIVGQQPELVILMVGAAFIWLTTISLVAFVWWALVPARSMLWLLVLYGGVMQELGRWATYALHARLLRGLRAIGLQPTPSTRAAEALIVPAAVASGLGAGVMQSLVMYGSVLGGALLPGSLYAPGCAGLSVFAVDALQCLAFQVLHVLLCLIGWTAAYPRRSRPLLAAIVALHLGASATTLLNTVEDTGVGASGCALALPCLFAVVAVAGALAAHIAITGLCMPRKPRASAPTADE